MKYPTQQVPRSNNTGPFSTPVDEILRISTKPGELLQFPKISALESDQRLILSLEGNIIREYPVNNRNITIGRSHGNDIQLNDHALSRRHAHIFSKSNQLYIEDLGSSNGTLVNGCLVKESVLKYGDIIQVGNHQITCLCNLDTPSTTSMFIKAEHEMTMNSSAVETICDNAQKYGPIGWLQTIGKNHAQSQTVMVLHKTLNILGFSGKRIAQIKRGTSGYTISAISDTPGRRARDIPMLNRNQLGNNHNPLQPGDLITIAGYDIKFDILN